MQRDVHGSQFTNCRKNTHSANPDNDEAVDRARVAAVVEVIGEEPVARK